MKNKALLSLIVLFITFGLSVPQPPAQAAEIRITISIKIMIKITFSGQNRPAPKPAEVNLSPQQVSALSGSVKSSSVEITWAAPKNGKPKNGYSIELASANKSLVPDSGTTWTLQKYNVGQDVTEIRVTGLDPSTFYEVMVTANDEYGVHNGDPVTFCSPSYDLAEASCFSNISATKGSYLNIPESAIDPNTSIWNFPDKARKNGSINVNWSAVKGASSYVVQWYGQQSPIDFGEKEVLASGTSATISGLPGNYLYYVRVLALGANASYSESNKVRVFASPGSATGPLLTGGINTCIGVGNFISLGINSQTPQAQSDRLQTKAFITRFRKQSETIWQNADQILRDGKRCLTPSTYPDNSDRRSYFLPDETSNYEFQVAEVSNTPTGGGLVGDWSYSRWFGPNSLDLNRNEVNKLGPNEWGSSDLDALKTKGTNALPRFQADRAYRIDVDKLQITAEAKAAAELKAKQEAEAKAAAELKAKQEAEAKAAAELKAKQEAEAKAAAELKAKQEAEANAAAELKAKQEAEANAAAELKAKQEAEANAAAELKAKQEADAKAAAEFKAKQEADAKAAALKKTTINCIKGKLSKKVTAVKPKCPTGYKLKK